MVTSRSTADPTSAFPPSGRVGVYCPDTDAVYLVPIQDVGPHTSAYLRVEPARNNQTKGVRWAVDYELVPKSD